MAVDVDKVRRDLYAISVAMLLFNLANGTFLPTLATPVGVLQLGRMWVLYIAVWVVWAYFLWRFWQGSRLLFYQFRGSVHQAVLASESYRSYCNGVWESFKAMTREARADGHRAGELGFDPHAASNLLHELERNSHLRFKVQSDSWGGRCDPLNIVTNRGEVQLNLVLTKAPPPFMEEAQRIVKARPVVELFRPWIRAAWENEAFADLVLPLFVALASAMVQLARLGWWQVM